MNKRLIIAGLLIYTIAAIFVSIFIIKPPKPIIEIKGEPLIVISENSNEMLTVAITNTLFTAWLVTALLIIGCVLVVRGRNMIPSGMYNAFEAIIEVIYNFVTGLAGEKNGRRFFPLIATLFIFITVGNWLSLTPVFNTFGMYVPLHEEESEFHEHALVFKDAGGVSLINPGAEFVDVHAEDAETHEPCAAGHDGDECRHEAIEHAEEEHASADDEKLGVLFPYLRGMNTDLMTPLAFAIVSVALIQWWGITTLGFGTYMKKFFNFSSPINLFVGFLELIAEIARLISFTFRLFGNMLAGEILLLVMTFLVAVASPIMVVFYGLELFVGAIQAFVFGALTLVFAVGAVEHHGSGGHDDHDEHDEHHGTDPGALAEGPAHH